jgi:hypothetical protein
MWYNVVLLDKGAYIGPTFFNVFNGTEKPCRNVFITISYTLLFRSIDFLEIRIRPILHFSIYFNIFRQKKNLSDLYIKSR